MYVQNFCLFGKRKYFVLLQTKTITEKTSLFYV